MSKAQAVTVCCVRTVGSSYCAVHAVVPRGTRSPASSTSCISEIQYYDAGMWKLLCQTRLGIFPVASANAIPNVEPHTLEVKAERSVDRPPVGLAATTVCVHAPLMQATCCIPQLGARRPSGCLWGSKRRRRPCNANGRQSRPG